MAHCSWTVLSCMTSRNNENYKSKKIKYRGYIRVFRRKGIKFHFANTRKIYQINKTWKLYIPYIMKGTYVFIFYL